MPSGKKEKVGTKEPSLSSILTRNALMRMAGPVYFGRGEGYFKYLDSIRMAHKRKRNFVRLMDNARLS